jgi:hypothetical protein
MSRTCIVVPSCPAIGLGPVPSSSSINPLRKSAMKANSEPLSLLVTVTFDTNDIEARASPLNPKLLTLRRSPKVVILLVAKRSQRRGKSCFYVHFVTSILLITLIPWPSSWIWRKSKPLFCEIILI